MLDIRDNQTSGWTFGWVFAFIPLALTAGTRAVGYPYHHSHKVRAATMTRWSGTRHDQDSL